MMSKEVLSLNSISSPISPQSSRESVNHGGQESKSQQNILLNDQNEDVANTWTEVFRARTSRLNRQKVSNQSEKNYITPSPFGPVKVSPFRVPLNKNAPPSTKQDPQGLPKKRRAKKK